MAESRRSPLGGLQWWPGLGSTTMPTVSARTRLGVGRAMLLALESPPGATAGAGQAGGANVYVRSIVPRLVRRGVPWEVDVLTRKTSRTQRHIEPLEPGLEPARVINVRDGPARPMSKASLYERLDHLARHTIRAAKQHGPYQVISSHCWLSGVVAVACADLLDLPLIHHFHSLGRSRSLAGVAAVSPQRIAAEEDVVIRADLLVAASASEAEALVGRYGASPDKVRIVRSGVDHELFSPGDRLAARDRLCATLEIGNLPGHLVVFVGRLDPVKGIDVVVDAISQLRRRGVDVELVIVGGFGVEEDRAMSDDEERERRRLQQRIGGVSFLPAQPRELLHTVYQAADLVLIPSRDEPFGLVALEAQACGTPVVASRTGGLSELVGDGTTGLLVSEWTPSAWANAMESLLAPGVGGRFASNGSRDRLGLMREAAALHARAFDWETTAAKLLTLWAEAQDTRARVPNNGIRPRQAWS